ncbi:MAG: FAD-binding oxidoreductase [Azospirillaceae bacterium]|nr:FAD-binding oxidoreductase [Azospirillaceae bacterium]
MSFAASYDVVIVGGAVTGSSVAWHLAADPDFNGRVLVIEKDPSYQCCASALSAASIRQQYSSAINIEISLFGIRFLRAIGETLAVDGEAPAISLHEGGYLFLARDAQQRDILETNHALQTRLGADMLLMDAAELARRWPYLATGDVIAASWGRTGEGWFDGYGLMQAFRRKARALGVTYRAAEAVTIERSGGRVVAVRLNDGERIACGVVVNAAGTGAADLAASAGIPIPIRRKKRLIFTFAAEDTLPGFPMLIDATGAYVRPEGNLYLCGIQPPEDQDDDPAPDDFSVDYPLFEDHLWPILAERVPAFERIKPGRAWAGHYDMNMFDFNAIVGPVPDLSNFYLANGFSGHGLQQSPAIGRGLAEHIIHGRYVTLDLSPLGYQRIVAKTPHVERNIV